MLPNLVTASCLTVCLILAIIYLPSDKSTRTEEGEEEEDEKEDEKKRLLPEEPISTIKDYSSTSGHAFQPMTERQYFCIHGGHSNGGPAMYTIEHKHEPITARHWGSDRGGGSNVPCSRLFFGQCSRFPAIFRAKIPVPGCFIMFPAYNCSHGLLALSK